MDGPSVSQHRLVSCILTVACTYIKKAASPVSQHLALSETATVACRYVEKAASSLSQSVSQSHLQSIWSDISTAVSCVEKTVSFTRPHLRLRMLVRRCQTLWVSAGVWQRRYRLRKRIRGFERLCCTLCQTAPGTFGACRCVEKTASSTQTHVRLRAPMCQSRLTRAHVRARRCALPKTFEHS